MKHLILTGARPSLCIQAWRRNLQMEGCQILIQLYLSKYHHLLITIKSLNYLPKASVNLQGNSPHTLAADG